MGVWDGHARPDLTAALSVPGWKEPRLSPRPDGRDDVCVCAYHAVWQGAAAPCVFNVKVMARHLRVWGPDGLWGSSAIIPLPWRGGGGERRLGGEGLAERRVADFQWSLVVSSRPLLTCRLAVPWPLCLLFSAPTALWTCLSCARTGWDLCLHQSVFHLSDFFRGLASLSASPHQDQAATRMCCVCGEKR